MDIPTNNHAQQIMADPAAAVDARDAKIKRVLDALPGLVGGVDNAFRDQTGEHHPFVLLVFAEGVALHAANFDPVQARMAVIQVATRWDEDAETGQVVS